MAQALLTGQTTPGSMFGVGVSSDWQSANGHSQASQQTPTVSHMTNLLQRLKPITAAACLLCAGLSFSTAVAQNAPPATPAAASSSEGPKLTTEQRIDILEAYLTNGNPTATLKTGPKDKDGNPTIPDCLLKNAPTAVNSGPGHNAWAGMVLTRARRLQPTA